MNNIAEVHRCERRSAISNLRSIPQRRLIFLDERIGIYAYEERVVRYGRLPDQHYGRTTARSPLYGVQQHRDEEAMGSARRTSVDLPEVMFHAPQEEIRQLDLNMAQSVVTAEGVGRAEKARRRSVDLLQVIVDAPQEEISQLDLNRSAVVTAEGVERAEKPRRASTSDDLREIIAQEAQGESRQVLVVPAIERFEDTERAERARRRLILTPLKILLLLVVFLILAGGHFYVLSVHPSWIAIPVRWLKLSCRFVSDVIGESSRLIDTFIRSAKMLVAFAGAVMQFLVD